MGLKHASNLKFSKKTCSKKLPSGFRDDEYRMPTLSTNPVYNTRLFSRVTFRALTRKSKQSKVQRYFHFQIYYYIYTCVRPKGNFCCPYASRTFDYEIYILVCFEISIFKVTRVHNIDLPSFFANEKSLIAGEDFNTLFLTGGRLRARECSIMWNVFFFFSSQE